MRKKGAASYEPLSIIPDIAITKVHTISEGQEVD